MKPIRNIVLLPNPAKDVGLALSRKVAGILAEAGGRVFLDETYATDLSGFATPYRAFPAGAELILVVGGDGSMLDASVKALAHDLPLLGVNLGKLGYLSEIEPDEIASLSALIEGNYSIEEKMLLSAERIADGKVVSCSDRLALNDVVVSHETYLGITDFLLSGGSGALRYRADGMIVSTPAGSTAYSLSAGGPILSHKIDALLATPVCPHSFFNRSILFPTDSAVRIENAGSETLRVSVDGRHFSDLLPGEVCRVSVSDRRIRFVTFRDDDMFNVLFRKMKIMEENQ